MDATRATALTRATRRHWWVVCAGVLACIAGGAIALALTAPVYSSSTSVLVQPIGGDEVNLETEAQLVRSTATAEAAAALLGGSFRPGPPKVDVLANTSVLIIRYEGATAADAQSGARAFAEAYLATRAAGAKSAIMDQIAALTKKINESTVEVAATNARIAELPPTSPELANLRSTLTTLTAQITTLTTRVNDLATTTVTPGRVIEDANLPAAPVRPDGWLYVGVAGGLGLVAGVAAAIGRDRFSTHVRHAVDVSSRSGVPLLAELADDGTESGYAALTGHSDGLASPQRNLGRAFNRLRNEVVASLDPADRLILVTAASPGAASTVVAANLAAALARADNEVVLVGANAPEIGAEAVTLAQLFDVGDVPGLTDVLTGRASLSRALQRAARSPRLRIVTPGGTASAGGLLQSEGVRSALHALRRQARYVVVEAPSAASGADAQSLAGAVDAAILVVEVGRTRHAQVADAAVQVRLVGTRLLGAVVLPRGLANSREAAPFRPIHRAEDADELATEVWLNDSRAAVDAPTTSLKQVKGSGAGSLQTPTQTSTETQR